MMATPTKNSDEEAESPTMYVLVTELLQIVVFSSMSGNWLNLSNNSKWKVKIIIYCCHFIFHIHMLS